MYQNLLTSFPENRESSHIQGNSIRLRLRLRKIKGFRSLGHKINKSEHM